MSNFHLVEIGSDRQSLVNFDRVTEVIPPRGPSKNSKICLSINDAEGVQELILTTTPFEVLVDRLEANPIARKLDDFLEGTLYEGLICIANNMKDLADNSYDHTQALERISESLAND